MLDRMHDMSHHLMSTVGSGYGVTHGAVLGPNRLGGRAVPFPHLDSGCV